MTWVFWKTFKIKIKLCSSIDSFRSLNVYDSSPRHWFASFLSLFLIRLFGGAQGREWRESILVLHILQSQKSDPMEKTRHTIRLRCACVWNISRWNSHPLSSWLYLLFWDVGYLCFILFSFLILCFGHGYIFFVADDSPQASLSQFFKTNIKN